MLLQDGNIADLANIFVLAAHSCFGGRLTHDAGSRSGFPTFFRRVGVDNSELFRVDVIVCLDACFMQKRQRRPQGHAEEDDPLSHPDSLFLSREAVHETEAYIADRTQGAGFKCIIA